MVLFSSSPSSTYNASRGEHEITRVPNTEYWSDRCAVRLGISISRVSQIRQAAIRKLAEKVTANPQRVARAA